jgi:hypothetical protein
MDYVFGRFNPHTQDLAAERPTAAAVNTKQYNCPYILHLLLTSPERIHTCADCASLFIARYRLCHELNTKNPDVP